MKFCDIDGASRVGGDRKVPLPSSNRRCRFPTSGSPESSRLRHAQVPIRTGESDTPAPAVEDACTMPLLPGGDKVSDCAFVDDGSDGRVRTSRFPSTRQWDTQRKRARPGNLWVSAKF